MILRPYRPDDLDRVAELFEAISVAAYGSNDQPREELLKYFKAPTTNIEEDVRLAFEGGRLVGFVDADSQVATSWWSDVRVAPGEDTNRIVSVLLEWAERRAGSGVLHVFAPSTLTDMADAFAAAGYRRVRASYRMEIELDEPLEPVAPPAGIEIRTLREDELHAAYEVHVGRAGSRRRLDLPRAGRDRLGRRPRRASSVASPRDRVRAAAPLVLRVPASRLRSGRPGSGRREPHGREPPLRGGRDARRATG